MSWTFSKKDLRLFLCTQKAYFSQILFTNLSKYVLVSTSPLLLSYQDADVENNDSVYFQQLMKQS